MTSDPGIRRGNEDAVGDDIRTPLDSGSQAADTSREAGDPACLACLVCPDCGAVMTEGHATGCLRAPPGPAAREARLRPRI